MIEEEATVARVDEGRVWVEKIRQSACSSCKQTCASATVGRHLDGKPTAFSVISDIELHPGDRVVVGVREDALVLGSLGIYVLPLLGLLLGAILGQGIAKNIAVDAADVGAMAGGFTGLLISFGFLKFTPIFSRSRFQPMVLRKLG
jgi:sigma-E factor negative regulatory protein RseC